MQEYVEYQDALDLTPQTIRMDRAMLTRGRGFHALTDDTDYGADTLTQEHIADQGTYLLAVSTGIDRDEA